MLLAIDPGLSTGWALFNQAEKTLASCGAGDPGMLTVGHLIIEKPQVYPGTPAGKANDLVTLAFQAGRYVGSIPHRELTVVKPHAWKGDIPKHIHHQRIWRVLSEVEGTTAAHMCRGLLEYLVKCQEVSARKRKAVPDTAHKDVMDAIGLGLYALNRLRP